MAPAHLHLHRHVDQAGWVEEFSRYDAGWLHAFVTENGGEVGVFFDDDLRSQLEREPRMSRLQENMWRCREEFTFDRHAPRLVELFKAVACGAAPAARVSQASLLSSK